MMTEGETNIERAVGLLTTKIDGLGAALSQVQADLAEIRATLTETKRRQESEIGTLFRVREDHDKRLAAIERDYTPRSACELKHAESLREHERFRADIGALNVTTGKLVTIASVVSGVVSIAANLAAMLLKGKGVM